MLRGKRLYRDVVLRRLLTQEQYDYRNSGKCQLTYQQEEIKNIFKHHHRTRALIELLETGKYKHSLHQTEPTEVIIVPNNVFANVSVRNY